MPGIDWVAESLRMTTFHNIGDLPSDASGPWESVMQRQPEQVSGRPVENLHVANGPYDSIGMQLQCTVRPDRSDWALQYAPPAPGVPQTGLVTVGPFGEVLPAFQVTCSKWLSTCPNVTRLAFGAVLMAEARDLQDAYKQLDAVLPFVELHAANMSDFFYQINRRRNLASVRNCLANRISRWSAAQVGSVEFLVEGNSQPQVSSGPDLFACRLELDVNTATRLTNVSGFGAVRLFGELVNFGREISEKGDLL